MACSLEEVKLETRFCANKIHDRAYKSYGGTCETSLKLSVAEQKVNAPQVDMMFMSYCCYVVYIKVSSSRSFVVRVGDLYLAVSWTSPTTSRAAWDSTSSSALAGSVSAVPKTISISSKLLPFVSRMKK